jgi:bidirectional [NiFe] hydrogenase diaphorase subunit
MSVKTLTLDNISVAAEEGKTILEAAKEAGIHIPTLCYLEGVSPAAACRVCLVEIEGSNKLLAACVTQVTEGMVVHTNTPRISPHGY